MRGGARCWTGLLAAGVVALAAPRVPAQPPAAPPAGRPNVLFIAIDDLNEWVGFLDGHPDLRTPRLDALASSGVVFERAYAAAPSCNPSRAALLTGLRPTSTGIYENRDVWRNSPLARRVAALPLHFRRQGFETRGAGKIVHLPSQVPGYRSWWRQLVKEPDRFWSAPPLPGSVFGPAWPRHLGVLRYHAWTGPERELADVANVDRAVAWLREGYERPFFVAVGLYRPHIPWVVPQRYFDRFDRERIELPPAPPGDLADVPARGRQLAREGTRHASLLEFDDWRSLVHAYLASVAFVDDQVGRLLDALAGSRHAANTIVVLWSDHGYHLGQKQHWEKSTLWEVATRSALVVRAPGVGVPGARVGTPVSLLDVYPTLAELTGVAAPEHALEGRSLVAQLRAADAPRPAPVLMSQSPGDHAVRSARWRYIRYRDGGEELYDHDADPHEWRNLAGEARLVPVKRELAAHLPTAAAPPARRGGDGRARLGGARGRAAQP